MDWNQNGKHDIQDDMIDYEVYKKTQSKEDSNLNTGSNKQVHNSDNKHKSSNTSELGGLSSFVIVTTIILFFVALFSEGIGFAFELVGLGFVALLVARFIETH